VKPLILPALAMFLAACQASPPLQRSASPSQFRGQAYAQASCSSCHAIRPGATSSPNPQAPPFVSIVNQEGLSRQTLNTWLRDAHNYPDEMAFELNAGQVDDLVSYMLTLKDPRFKPVG